MPSFLDSGVIVLLVLLLFGPKKLPVLARQLGKLMNDFRRASNEFRTQMEDELRISEQAERQKQVPAEASVTPTIEPTPAIEAETSDNGSNLLPNDPANDPPPEYLGDSGGSQYDSSYSTVPESSPGSTSETSVSPLPIATSGDLSIMPPTTGLPTPTSQPAALPEDLIEAHQPIKETEALHS